MESVEDQVFGFIRGDVSCADFIQWGCLHPDITIEIPDFFDVFNVPESDAEHRLVLLLESWFKQQYPGTTSLSDRKRIAELASAVLEDQGQPQKFFAAIQAIASLLRNTEIPENDRARLTVEGIASEAEGLPIGPQRRYWNKDVLARKDVEIARYCESVYEMGITACRELLRRFSNPPTSTS